MSHFTKVSTQIKDLEALREALSSMGLELRHNEPCRYYYGVKEKRNVAKLPGPYDVAFERNQSGTFDIDADFYNGHVEEVIGIKGSLLMERYSRAMLKVEARKKGYSIHEYPNGKIKIYDPTDSSGGYLDVIIDKNGNITFKAVGFSGKNCMKFSSLEDAFGTVSRRKTEDYYHEDMKEETRVQRRW